MDFNSDRILVEHNADMRVEPASITKLMTAYVVFSELDQGNITLEETVAISEKAWRTGGSTDVYRAQTCRSPWKT